MRDFFKRALKKLAKLTAEQVKELLVAAAEEIDRLETVLDSINEGILVCDANHNLLRANKFAERYLPNSHYEQENLPIWNLVGDDRVRAFLEGTLCSGDKAEGREFDVEMKGKPRLLSISVLPLVRDRQVSGSLIYVEDITEKRGREAQLRRAENLASLTTLAAGVAHEIKNPLGSLSIHVQLMQRALAGLGDSPDAGGAAEAGKDSGGAWLAELERYIAIVNEEIDRLNHIVVDFLFAVRPMDLELREGDINSIITDLVEFVRYELEEAHISCAVDLKKDIPLVDLDERYMKQALLNLIKNAIAAMPEGGKLSISTGYTDSDIVVTVADSGIGISESNLPKIFEPYFTTRETGSGLGLTLVFKIIREHRGEVSVKSREGEGASFIITLPIPQKETRLLGFDDSLPAVAAKPAGGAS
ncbi:MAG: PAS domain S-box protein [Spirochaetaceae bacterium]|jgi:PAS domain S-box-containing protein|nr:PAS domain S-box protein [Spirochaetaceae bacterium]